MISRRTFMLALAVAAIVAAIGAPPKSITLSIMFSPYTSPYNVWWNGTSRFVEALESLGYEVVIVNTQQMFMEIDYDKIVYVSIAPETPYTSRELGKLVELARRSSLKIIYADEKAETANSFITPLFGAEIADGYLSIPLTVNSSVPAVGHVIFSRYPASTRVYRLRINMASAIMETGVLKPVVRVELPLTLRNDSAYTILYAPGGWPLVAVWSSGDDGAVVVSDSSLFINLYWDSEISDNPEFAVDLVRYLTNDDRSYRVYVDNFHYDVDRRMSSLLGGAGGVSLPIPPIGLLAGLAMARLARVMDREFLLLIYSSDLARVMALTAAAIVCYVLASRRVGPFGYDEETPRFEGLVALGETPIKRRLASPKQIKREEYKHALSALYEVLEELFRRYADVDLSRVPQDPQELDKARRVVGKEFDEHLKAITTLRKIHLNVTEGKLIFPPIVFWRRTFNRLVEECEIITEKFGASIVGKEGLKGVEYKLRRR